MIKTGLKHRLLSTCLVATLSGAATVTTVLSVPVAAQAQSTIRFSSFAVTGNQAIPSETVIALAGLVAGEATSPAGINEALRRLYASGLFEFADIRVAAGRLIIEVRENPTINIINFEGNSSINDNRLASIVESAARGPMNRATVEADARRISQLYAQGSRFGAEVRPTIIRLENGQVNLVFEVLEGRIDSVEGVNIVGNSSFTDRRLRRIVRSREAGPLAAFLPGDNFSLDNMQADELALLEFYRERGFVDASVQAGLSEFALNRDGVFLTYTVNEGAIYDFGASSVATELPDIDVSAYQRLARMPEGRRYRASRVQDAVESIEAAAAADGHPFLRAVPRFIKNEGTGTVDVVFDLVNGRRLYIERIDIRGNSQTLDRVIRREFDIVEGDPLNQRQLREAEAALNRLRYFSSVDVRVREGSAPDQAVVEVDVADTSTGSFTFGAGYSTDVGFSGQLSISENNFLGRGQRFSLSLDYGESSTVAALSFTEPQLGDRDLSVGFNLYYRSANRSESSFQTTEYGFSPNLAFPVGENSRLSLNYELVSEEIRDTTATTSPVIQEGIVTRSAVGFSLQHDTRNDTFDPTTGYILRFGGQFAGLGGDVNYAKVTARGKAYLGLFDDAVVLSADVEGGALFSLNGTESRITDRFFLGGTGFRGYAVGGIGPRDDDGGDINDALGGNFFAIARFDAAFPLGLPEDLGLRGGAFVDVGSVWGLDGAPVGASGVIDSEAYLRATAGLALYWDTPLGPLRFSWAYPIVEHVGDVTQVFSVSVSTNF